MIVFMQHSGGRINVEYYHGTYAPNLPHFKICHVICVIRIIIIPRSFDIRLVYFDGSYAPSAPHIDMSCSVCHYP